MITATWPRPFGHFLFNRVRVSHSSTSLKSSAFTGNPDYFELLYFLDDLLIRTSSLAPASLPQPGVDAGRDLEKIQAQDLLVQKQASIRNRISGLWQSKQRMEESLRLPHLLSALQFRRIRSRLGALAERLYPNYLRRVQDQAPSKVALDGQGEQAVAKECPIPELSEFLRAFLAEPFQCDEDALSKVFSSDLDLEQAEREDNSSGGGGGRKRLYGHLDHLGRAVAIGRRKCSVAKVTLSHISQSEVCPRDPLAVGEIRVNGRLLSTHFPRIRDRMFVARPLVVAEAVGHFNVWAMTSGGGLSGTQTLLIATSFNFDPVGQAGAIQLALAKTLATFDPSKMQVLRQASLLRRDLRVVERKKPGQPKARKKFAWVKR